MNFEPEFKIIVTERAKHFAELENHDVLTDEGKDLLFIRIKLNDIYLELWYFLSDKNLKFVSWAVLRSLTIKI